MSELINKIELRSRFLDAGMSISIAAEMVDVAFPSPPVKAEDDEIQNDYYYECQDGKLRIAGRGES